MNRIVTLTTDFGLKDPYAGIVKGVILSINSSAQIIDIAHNVSPHDILEGSFYIYQSYAYFPEGTIHTGVVDPGVGSERRPVVIETEDYFFVGPDNGLFSHVLGREKVRRIIHITNSDYFPGRVSHTFHGRDIFAPVAAHLSMGADPGDMGVSIDDPCTLPIPVPERSGSAFRGEVVYVDSFGNLITNITDKDIEYLKSLSTDIEIRIKGLKIEGVCKTYSMAGTGKPIALIGSCGYLEIACNCKKASDALNAAVGEKVEAAAVPGRSYR